MILPLTGDAVAQLSDTDLAWQRWGERDPYFGVLTDPRYRSNAMTPDSLDEFFASGRVHVGHVIDVCGRSLGLSEPLGRVLDFGCGVGRLVLAFAETAQEVVGVDVAHSMLAEAKRNCEARGLRNTSLVRSDDTLSQVAGQFHLVHSAIVLQHIEPSRGRVLIKRLLERMLPGGYAAIHVTFGWDSWASTFGQPVAPELPSPPTALQRAKRVLVDRMRWLRVGTPSATMTSPDPPPIAQDEGDPAMEMHFYNISEVLFLLHTEGIRELHTELTDHGGALGTFLYFRKPLAP